MSKVYYSNLRCKPGLNLLKKLRNLVKAAGIEQIDFNGQYTAVKLHFGEPGNMAYIRPNYVATVVDLLNSLGAKTFLTDSHCGCRHKEELFKHLHPDTNWESGLQYAQEIGLGSREYELVEI